MQRQQRTVQPGPAPKFRENIQGLNHVSKRIPARGISGRKRGDIFTTSSTGNALSSFIGVELKKISAFRKGIQYSYAKKFDELESFIEIYQCLINAPSFIDRTDWKSNTSVEEMGEWLFSEVKKAVGEHEWLIYKNYDDEYVIKYYNEHHEMDNFYVMPLEWLPEFKEYNFELYEMILYTIGCIVISCGVSISSQYEYFIVNEIENDLDEEDRHWMEIDIRNYKKGGEQYEFCQLIYRKGREITLEACIKLIERYKPKSLKQRIYHNWLKLAIPLLKSPFDLCRYNFNQYDPDNNDGSPVMPSDYYSFTWSFHDKIYEQIECWQNDTASSIGNTVPCEVGEFNKKEHIPSQSIEHLKGLKNFLIEGREIYSANYDSAYKKNYDNRKEY